MQPHNIMRMIKVRRRRSTLTQEPGEKIDVFLATVPNAAVMGDAFQLIGFGSFSTGARAARTGPNPKTGEALQIAATTTVKFTAGNPWSGVTDRATIMREVEVQVERALSANLWAQVR